jgi:anaerobic selenocysteine-containing dehydrogenase
MAELDVRDREPSKSQKQSDGLTRRNFLKTTAVAAGVVALGSSSGCGSIATLQSPLSGEESIRYNGCQHNGCGACMGQVVVKDNKVTAIKTWPDDPRGRRPCARGRVHWQRLYAGERIKYPMRRVGERLEDKWEQISWDEAIKEITDKWKGYMKDYGSQSVYRCGAGALGGGYLNSYLLTRLNNVLGWTAADACSDMAMAKGLNKVFGPAYNTWATPPFEMRNVHFSKALISWSGNITVASTYEWKWIIEALEKGTKLVTVDPMYTVLAQKSSLWIRPRPGTDTVLQFAMMKHIIDNNLIDREFLLSHTVAPVLVREDTKRYLRMSDLGVEPTEGPINPMTGMPVIIDPPVVWDEKTNAPGALDEVEVPALTGGYTINNIRVATSFDFLVDVVNEWPLDKAAEFTEVPVEQIVELAELSANTPVYHYTGYGSQSYNNGVQTGHALATLTAITGNMGKPGAGCSNGWHAPQFNIAYIAPTGAFATAIPELALFDVMTSGKFMGNAYPIKSMYLCGHGLIGGTVDTNRTMREIIDKMEYIVCQDVVFSDQARVADIVLPVCHNYEYDELFASGTYTCFSEKAVDPAFESKPDGEIFKLIAKAMDVGEYFDLTDDELIELALDAPEMKAAGVSYQTVKSQRAYRHRPLDYVPSTIFPTDTGRMEFYVDAPFPRVNFGQEFDFDAEHLPRWFPPTEGWSENPLSQEYPLIFMSERARNRIHSLDYESTWINELEPEPIIRINPTDAAARGILEDDYVEVYNTRGHAVARARLSEAMRPGTVTYPKGWQLNQFKAGAWGELHNSEFDPVGVNNSYFDSLCEIRPWNEEV